MPYINQEIRQVLDDHNDVPLSPGELNYVITKLCNDYLSSFSESYTAYNAVIGVLECAKQELYRRMVVPYEEQKRFENGDVYGRKEEPIAAGLTD